LARQLARTNPLARLVVTGCYATLEGETVAALPNVALVVGNSRKDDLFGLIQGAAAEAIDKTIPIQPAGLPLHAGMPIPALDRTRAFVKVQDGCHNRCTFCIVTVARGEECSRPVDAVVEEINADLLKRRALAQWVAQNQLAMMQLNPTRATTADGTARQGGIDFVWRAELAPTPNAAFRKVDIGVAEKQEPGYRLARLSAYLSLSQ
jgi:hypothetical protein